jgi:6-phosphogluconolactonase
MALSGGATPEPMLAHLATLALPWRSVDVVQVDERVAPDRHRDRNLTQLRAALPPEALARIYPIPVALGPEVAAEVYAAMVRGLAGSPPVVDVAHLGLGADGHTASLVSDDAALGTSDAVAATGTYQGRRRVTLTLPTLDAARHVVWLVTGAGKAAVLARLLAADPAIPAGRVRQDNAVVVCDPAAAGR